MVDCRNENQSPLMELIPEFSGDKNTKVKPVIWHGSGPHQGRRRPFLELKHHRTKTISTSEHEKLHDTQVYHKKNTTQKEKRLDVFGPGLVSSQRETASRTPVVFHPKIT